MRLLSCKHPSRVYNKYLDKYIFVPCGQCSICRNRRAAKYSNLLERERSQHRYSFFVTLTYDDDHLPLITFGDFGLHSADYSALLFYPSKQEDFGCISFKQFFPPEKSDLYDENDINFFRGLMEHGGIPYASKREIQLFLKRLNKYIHDKVTCEFKNFRYFIVSEYGSTTFRPHFHGIFFVDNERLASRFKDCVSACWKYGITDCQPVENSACGYVSQYVNKSADLPFFYKTGEISPFILCSRRPYIGTFSESPAVDAEIVNDSVVTTYSRGKKYSSQFVNVPLQPSYQNRLFPKCPLYGSVSDTLRVGFYTATLRFRSSTFREFLEDVFYSVFIRPSYVNGSSELIDFLKLNLSLSDDYDSKVHNLYFDDPLSLLDKYSYNFIRRLFYLSRKVTCQAKQFGLSVLTYIRKIIEYYKKKELYLLNKMYEFQENISKEDCDSIALMYPEFLFEIGYNKGDSVDLESYIEDISSNIGSVEVKDADFFAFSNKKTHFKNAYLDSLRLKREYYFLYLLIKTYFYGKKCDEVNEAFSS